MRASRKSYGIVHADNATVLQDPNVSASPIENRIAFLQSKNLTQDEIDLALARAGGEGTAPANYSNYGSQQQVARQVPGGYGGYQQYSWQHRQKFHEEIGETGSLWRQ